ncbi:MAG: 2-hydroxyacid dehydrogenase [Myxococcota bacterium]
MFDAKPYDRTAFQARKDPRVQLHFLESKLSVETAGLAEGSAAVCAFVNDDLSAPVLRRLSDAGVGLIALRCAGFNNVDVAEAKKLGLDLARVPAYSPHAVAEHAMALVLALDRKVHRAHNRVREGNFQLAGLVGFDLYEKTAGVVGLGKIGRCFARIAKGFGMRVLAYDAFPDPSYAAAEGIEFVDLDTLLAASEVVSLHAPLTPDSHHLLDASRLARMKPGAILVNTSRGGLIDTQALIDVLKSGQLGAAGLDVYEEESEWFFEDRSNQVITDDVLARLLQLHNVLVTSHQAFLTREALDNIAETTLANIGEWLDGRRGSDLTHGVS